MHLQSNRRDRKMPTVPPHLEPLISNGLHVFPVYEPISENECSCPRRTDCEDIGKHPRITEFNHYASMHPNRIAQWAKKFPGCNWGVACGKSNIVVFDEDEPGDFAKLCANLGLSFDLPPTLTVATHKGHHFYFSNDHQATPFGNVNAFRSRGYAVDVRGNGGFVVAPGSTHRSGGRYEVVEP